MIKVSFKELGSIEDSKLKFVAIVTRYKDKWLYVRHKERTTWEIPGGHREENESISYAASRELFEEAGAIKYKIIPICEYAIESDENPYFTESFGGLFYAKVEELNNKFDFEIGEIKLFEDIPENLTYPLIQPLLHKKVIEFLKE
ncbi:NUDIX hydrolase [Caproiciproducens sp. MSJ-32]|uniref:NUDIX hydrolase n=1 Tax=Caproiciproducens sp. MSJ-32 TaxID=2841527 RepID=UPI001C10D071|nr:NUDIX domain-containing protein [Caproiciproducens sp. MSJ-32]MBU5454484.1 NUDIX domain-containing protein [Caproiciproducens sp. MSJ-32]